MNEMYFSGNNPKLGMQPSTNYLQQADTSKHEIKDINDTLLIASKLEEFKLPPFLRLKKNDPKVNLSQHVRSRMFKDFIKQDNTYAARLETNRAVFKDKCYVIEDGLLIFSMNGDIRIVQVKNYSSPFTFVCGKCDSFDYKPLLICRENYSDEYDGQYIIPDIFIAKLIAHRDKPDYEKQVSFNFSYLGSIDELETPSRATESPSCESTASLLKVILALLVDYNLGGEMYE